jgi:trk system potassium uptake protein TrkA
MKIIILGAGQVGTSLAEHLSAENNDITLVDTNLERLQVMLEKYDIRTVQGFASYPAVLRKAGADSADMLVAVTDNDEVNMIACQVAYSLYHTPMKIARVRSPQYFIRKDLYGADNLPIDVFISPEDLVTKNICQLINYPGSLQVLDFSDGKVKLIAVKPYYGGPLLGKSIGKMYEQFQNIDVRVVAVYRNDHAIPFDNQTLIEIGDEVFFVSDERYTHQIMSELRRACDPYKRIIIAGGGGLGANLAKSLQDNYQVKIIEPDKNRCHFLARTLQEAIILNGKISDKQLLISENIENIDVFCAVTNDDELNIIAGLQAKRLGVRQVMTLITQPSYVDLIEGGPINIAISPHLATTSAILTYLRRGDIVNVYSLRRGAAEAIEIVAHGDSKTSRVVGRCIDKIKLPLNTRIGAIVRNKKEVIMPTPDFVIEAEDHVILFVANIEDVREVEKLFQVSVGFF